MKIARFYFAAVSILMLPFWVCAADTYKVDPVHSTVLFGVKHMGFGRFWGRFNRVGGHFTLNASDPTADSFEIDIDPASVDTNNKDRDRHLKGPDFFSASEFPKIEFRSREAKKLDDKTLEVSGDLTFHGVTRPETVRIELIGTGSHPKMGHRAGIEATFVLKQSEFGIKAGPLGDDVHVIAALEGGAK
jgi:polyisoprenoid-binding protein YceI